MCINVHKICKDASKFLMLTALAGIGLGTSITDFRKAGFSLCSVNY